MNFKPLFKYNIFSSFKSILIFFSIYFGFNILSYITISMAAAKDGGFTGGSFGSTEVAAVIFTAIYGMVFVKENLQFGLANSVSRRSILSANLASIAIISMIISFAVNLIILVTSKIYPSTPIYALIFNENANVFVDGMRVSAYSNDYVMSTIWLGIIIFCISAIAMLISTLVYRIGKIQKIMFFVLTPFILFFFLPFIDKILLSSFFAKILGNVIKIFTGAMFTKTGDANPFISTLMFIILAVVLAFANYFMFRRIKLKPRMAA